jgi:pimeloyl-ACP methyl ester carboxylesterase
MLLVGRTLIYEHGNPQGIPLLLIHGGGGGVWTWNETLKYLQDFRCLLVELPEHGSSRSNGPFTIQSTAQSILEAVPRRVPDGKLHVFGLSVGGQIVVEMLSRAPETFRSAIISGAQLLPLPGYRLGIYSEHVMALIYWLGISPWKNNDAWIRWTMQASAGIPENLFEAFKVNFQGLTRDSWVHVMSENYRYRAPAGLEKARLPVLLVAGAHEKTDILPTNTLLNKLLPQSRMVLLPTAYGWTAAQEHNWPMNAPELCARMIRAWALNQALPDDL